MQIRSVVWVVAILLWIFIGGSVRGDLRTGVEADAETIATARAMQAQGWVYVMPEPKSPNASWGSINRKSEWYYGYWINEQTGQLSKRTPVLVGDRYVGDGQAEKDDWRRGGAPRRGPTVLEWLMSRHGGVPPNN